MNCSRAMCFNAALRAPHDSRRFSHVHFLPITQQEGFSLTCGNLFQSPLNLGHHLLLVQLFFGNIGNLPQLLGFQAFQKVVIILIILFFQAAHEGGPPGTTLIAPKVIAEGVLQDPLKPRGELFWGPIMVFFCKL